MKELNNQNNTTNINELAEQLGIAKEHATDARLAAHLEKLERMANQLTERLLKIDGEMTPSELTLLKFQVEQFIILFAGEYPEVYRHMKFASGEPPVH